MMNDPSFADYADGMISVLDQIVDSDFITAVYRVAEGLPLPFHPVPAPTLKAKSLARHLRLVKT